MPALSSPKQTCKAGCRRLSSVAHLPSTIHVRADAEGVYLRGTVNGREDKARAGQIARDTIGPDKTVHNELQVSGGWTALSHQS